MHTHTRSHRREEGWKKVNAKLILQKVEMVRRGGCNTGLSEAGKTKVRKDWTRLTCREGA